MSGRIVTFRCVVLLLASVLAATGCGGGGGPSTGTIVVTSTPSGAAIWLDGLNSGLVTPATIEGVEPGDHLVVLILGGYVDHSQPVVVVGGEISIVSVALERPASYTWTGELTASDLQLGGGPYYDVYSFDADAGEQVQISMNSAAIDPYLILLRRNVPMSGADVIAYDNDGGDGINSYIDIALPETRTYFVYATSYGVGEMGSYQLDVVFPNRVGGSGASARPWAAASPQR